MQHNQYQEPYHAVLCKEVATICERTQQATGVKRPPIKTLFLGGGTPSLYPLELLPELFTTLRNHVDLSTMVEATIEANPSDITEERLSAWHELGINRLSMGVQSLNDNVMRTLNRHQTLADVHNAIRLAPKYFNNLSIDLILGLPGVTPAQWFEELATVVSWPIKHISVYFLMVHEKTPLYFSIQQGKTLLSDDETLTNMYVKTVHFLEQHGFFQYEISNFAQNGYHSVHNCAYWDRKPYYGFGLGASSFDGVCRMTNTANLMTYLQSDRPEGFSVEQTAEKLTREQALLEHLMLSLRQKKGINLHHMVYFESEDTKSRFSTKVQNLIREGLLEERDGTIRLTLQGMMLENDVIVELL
jgi:oxygen-independent coproporphyrinogen-3 oxidase